MKASSILKKTAAVALSAALVVASVTNTSIVSEGTDVTLGEGTQTGSYISMPITIRDFAADGMLFEPNSDGTTADTFQVADSNASISVTAPVEKFDNTIATSRLSHVYFSRTNPNTEGGYIRLTSTNGSTDYTPITFYVNNKTYTRNDVRYLVMKYRTSAAPNTTPVIYQRGPGVSSNEYGRVNFDTSGYNKSTWTTVVIDLGQTDANAGTYVGSHTTYFITMDAKLKKGYTMDIAFASFFSSEAEANAYKDYFANRTDYTIPTTAYKTYHIGNNSGLGLIFTNTKSFVNNMQLITSSTDPWSTAGNITGSNFYNNSVGTPQTLLLNSGASQTTYGAMLRTDLVEGDLGEGKQLVYTEGTVQHLAELLEDTLPEVWENADGSRNMWHIMGINLFNSSNQYVGPGASSATKDLADILRDQITGGLGTYADAKAKNPKSYADVATYYDAAYFLLHNIFSDSEGYGKTVSEYNSLRLVEKKKSDGSIFYTFNSAYNDTVYDHTNGVIYNKQTTTATARLKADGTIYYNRGNMLPENCFNPVANLGYGISTNPYYEYLQHISGTTYGADLTNYYSNTNFNFSLEGHAQFVYYEDNDLYFTFTGDDDVYLFINGKRVLDLGGGHAIAKASIKLNDMKTELGLVDGKVYDFDFYYMERGGGAGNFGIETNMKIVEPSMVTNMLGFQNGVTTGYNGYVDASKNVGYGFELTNSGNEPITNLTFTDAAIGVTLTKDAITLNSRSKLEEMYAIVYNPDGTIKLRYNATELTESVLKSLLAGGIGAGEKIGIYGVKYDITTSDWTAGNDTFLNEVRTTAESRDSVTLTGYADWKVQKRDFTYDCFNIYDWAEQGTKQGVTVTKTELLAPIVKAGQSVTASSVSIVLCSPSGNTDTTALSKNAVLNADGSITYTGTEAGVENIYYKVLGSGAWSDVVFHYHAYTYSVADNAFVLDYGLPVELYDATYGFLANDRAVLAENTKATTSISAISTSEGTYGTFSFGADSLKYTPTDFMSGADSVTVTIRVAETTGELTKFNGVEMTQTVTVVPANVVYYEDDFTFTKEVDGETVITGITYLNNNGNQWVLGSGNTNQSADQNSNYGSDPNYANDRGATDSNGTISTLEVKATDNVLSFSFVGTGFELVSRTTYAEYAVIDVVVTDSTGKFVKRMPVITESKGGHLYQVPIISITDLARGSYTVTVKAGGSANGKTRMFYLDGIRIYNPLADSDAKTYYNPSEYYADITEIKQLIQDGKTIYANASESSSSLQFATGTTLIEDVQSNGVLTSVSSLNDYMTFGPNNELYLDGNAAVGMIAFYLTPDASVAEADRTIQIGAHRKVDSVNGANGYVTMTYGSTAADIVAGTHSYALYSATEQYYTIDVANLVPEEIEQADGTVVTRYLVMIGTNGSYSPGEILSLTNLKLSGYTITGVENALVSASEDGTLSDTSVVSEVSKVYKKNSANAN